MSDVVATFYHKNYYRENSVEDLSYMTKVTFKADSSVELFDSDRGNDDRSDAVFWGSEVTYHGTYERNGEDGFEAKFVKRGHEDCTPFAASFSVSTEGVCEVSVHDGPGLKYTTLDNKDENRSGY